MRALIIVLLFVATLQTYGQKALIKTSSDNRISIRAGIEPSTMLGVIYERNLNIGPNNKKLTAYGEFNSSFFRYGRDNSEIKVGGILPLYQSGNFMILNNLGFSKGNTVNKHFESKRFAISDEVAIGMYKKKWFYAATVEFEKIVGNKIEHTDFYRDTYYPDAVDGWYKGAGGIFQFGVEGGRSIGEKIDLHMELKFPFTEKLNAYGGAGMHMNIGVGFRF